MLQFENNADKYEKVRSKITYPLELYETLSSLCQNKNSALDLGCGNGVSTIKLKPKFKYVKGVDIGENLIKYARNSFPDLDFEVSKAEDVITSQKFDLITSATSFYWMDRPLVVNKLRELLNNKGVFCAYKYDFPIPYGKLRDFINFELATKWATYRDPRLVNYDDTLEVLNDSGVFVKTGRLLVSNIIELSPDEVAYFFLSTSYVTKYIEESGKHDYPQWFLNECCKLDTSSTVKINFDIQAFYAIK